MLRFGANKIYFLVNGLKLLFVLILDIDFLNIVMSTLSKAKNSVVCKLFIKIVIIQELDEIHIFLLIQSHLEQEVCQL